MDVAVDFNEIGDWDTFHEVFAKAMGFPEFYGRNNNAWIDCMSYIDDEDAGMSKVIYEETYTIVCDSYSSFLTVMS